MAKKYLYRFSNGHEVELGDGAKGYIDKYKADNNCLLTYSGWNDHIKNLHLPNLSEMSGDGFKAGWNPGIGCYVKSRSHHKRLLREKGLVEVGREPAKQDWSEKTKYFNHDDLKGIKAECPDISDNSLDALKD